LEKSTQALKALAEVEKARADAQKALSDVEKSKAEILRLGVEQRKLQYDADHAPQHDRWESIKSIVTAIGPILTTLALAATLTVQSFQFSRSETSKREAVEDAQWADAIKALAQSNKQVLPSVAILKPFLGSKRFAESARKVALQVLLNTENPAEFSQLLSTAYQPLDWETLPDVLKLDQIISAKLDPIVDKVWDKEKEVDDFTKLTVVEKSQFDNLLSQIEQVGAAIAPLLKATRPQGVVLDLRSVRIRNSDWSDVDLTGADIEGFFLATTSLKGANLRNIRNFTNASFVDTAWWEANEISPPELIIYLQNNCPYSEKNLYGPRSTPISRKEYDAAMKRLQRVVSPR
jgi:hypothetical protein